MARANIAIEDGAEGQITVAVTYEDGFIEDSEACHLAHVVHLQIGKWLETVGPEEVVGNAPSGRVVHEG